MKAYPVASLYEEMAFIAHHFHWSHDELMRLATAADEILPLRDPRVQQNEAYLAIIVLSRVITRLGSLADIHTGVIEGLYASDLAYLQRLYETFNAADGDVEVAGAGRSVNGVHAPRRMTAPGEA